MNSMYFLAGGFVAGAAVMYFVVLSVPALIPENVFKKFQDEQRRKLRLEQKEKAKLLDELSRKTSNLESYKTIITRYDIDHDMTISVRGRLLDMIADVKTTQRVRHLINLVFGDWNPAEKPLWKRPELTKFVHEIYEHEPSLPFFLTPNSIPTVLEMIYMHESGKSHDELASAPLPPMQAIHDRFVPEARKFFERIIADRVQADKVADECSARLERAIRQTVGAEEPAPESESISAKK